MRTILRWLGRQRWFWAILIGSVCLALRALALLLRFRRWWHDRQFRRYLRRYLGVSL
ncbi:MAG: hypothetical protein U1A78_41640 [Polyangia bacterium]